MSKGMCVCVYTMCTKNGGGGTYVRDDDSDKNSVGETEEKSLLVWITLKECLSLLQ